MNISTVDIVVFSSYCLLILFIGLYVSREKKGKEKSESQRRVGTPPVSLNKRAGTTLCRAGDASRKLEAISISSTPADASKSSVRVNHLGWV